MYEQNRVNFFRGEKSSEGPDEGQQIIR